MESRLVIFILLMLSLIGIMTLTGYMKYYNPDNKIKLTYVKDIESLKNKKEVKVEKAASGPSPVELGKIVYTETGKCITCHGDMGQGNVSEQAPVLKGQHDWYVYSTLKKFKSKERVNEKMDEYIANLTNDDFKNVAAYIGTLK